MPTPKKPAAKKPAMSDERARGVALGIFKGEIFTSEQVHEHDMHLLSIIFMPLALMNPKDKKKLLHAKPAMFFAEMEKALPQSINGYPVFLTMSVASEEDTKRIVAKFAEIKSAIEGVK